MHLWDVGPYSPILMVQNLWQGFVNRLAEQNYFKEIELGSLLRFCPGISRECKRGSSWFATYVVRLLPVAS